MMLIYLITLFLYIIFAIAVIYNKKLAREYNIHTYGGVIFTILLGCVPGISTFIAVLVLIAHLSSAKWWTLHRDDT